MLIVLTKEIPDKQMKQRNGRWVYTHISKGIIQSELEETSWEMPLPSGVKKIVANMNRSVDNPLLLLPSSTSNTDARRLPMAGQSPSYSLRQPRNCVAADDRPAGGHSVWSSDRRC